MPLWYGVVPYLLSRHSRRHNERASIYLVWYHHTAYVTASPSNKPHPLLERHHVIRHIFFRESSKHSQQYYYIISVHNTNNNLGYHHTIPYHTVPTAPWIPSYRPLPCETTMRVCLTIILSLTASTTVAFTPPLQSGAVRRTGLYATAEDDIAALRAAAAKAREEASRLSKVCACAWLVLWKSCMGGGWVDEKE